MSPKSSSFAKGAGKLFSRNPLLSQIWEKVSRDRPRMPAYVMWRKGLRYVEGLAVSPFYLRHCTSVGKRARMRGRPFIENLGKIVIGDDFNFVSLFVQSHLVTGHAGLLEIGNSVNINFGAAISAHEHVKIGDRVRIGPYAIIMDSDYHTAKDRHARPSLPVVIEEDVWLAGRVSVLKGARIGKGSVITAGSVVSGEIPAGVIAGGVPARVLRRIEGTDVTDVDLAAATAVRGGETRTVAAHSTVSDALAGVGEADVSGGSIGNAASSVAEENPELVARVHAVIADAFGVDGPLEADWGPERIAKWDSLGQLKLTVSLEEQFQIAISEDQLVGMSSVGEICRIVRDCVQAR